VTYPFESLPANLAAFCAMLRRDHRFLIGPGELQDAARALEATPLDDERALRDTLRPVLTASLDDVRIFDRAFDRFFHGGRGGPPSREALASFRGPNRDAGSPGTTVDGDQSLTAGSDAEAAGEPGAVRRSVSGLSDAEGEPALGILRGSYSPLDAEGLMPQLGPADRAWREAAAVLVSRVRAGLSRRWRPSARGQRVDFRRTLRRGLATGGDVVMPRWSARRRRSPRFVLLVDGSRSMAAYAESALQMAIALSSVTPDTETFVFSTALRRISRDVRRAVAGARLRLQLHHAWGGGTAIGACLREFVQRFGERLLGGTPVVVISSDGLDVGDPAVLGEAMARLARDSAGIVWLNPLLKSKGYGPTALGMRTARPFLTAFTSVTDPAGLVRLSRTLRIR
jgi:uncharacterized protein with von Willebrand factor type A (vWA) domain